MAMDCKMGTHGIQLHHPWVCCVCGNNQHREAGRAAVALHTYHCNAPQANAAASTAHQRSHSQVNY